ncbi:hypothetical protein OQA88_7566 [Cercophora sp. LCS_1]
MANGRANPPEAAIPFSASDADSDFGFMHNDLSESNIIVDNDMIVGIIDWEMASFFGWETAREVRQKVRTARREQFVNANLSEERLVEIMWWGDLYDDGV